MTNLASQFVDIHQAGIIRALASALDCLAGVVIGVAALPQSILKADFARVRRALGKIGQTERTGKQMQAQLGRRFKTAITDSGPLGWLDWTIDFRNILVHRGRRLEFGQFVPISYGPAPHSRRVSHLPRDPDRSDVEVFLGTLGNLVLHEEAQRTLEGLVHSTSHLLEMIASDLLEFWQWRRAHPLELLQPKKQWLDEPSTESGFFNGYAPGSMPFNVSIASTHPTIAHRFCAAALDDPRPQWKAFD